jgi:hypothetical protein
MTEMDLALGAGAVAPVAVHPGPISRLLVWLDAQGWRAFLWLVGFLLLLFAWNESLLWLAGRTPVGTLDWTIAAGLPYGPFSLGVLVVGRRIARRSFDDFWPATGWPPEARARGLAAFGPIRARDEWLALAVGLAGGGAALLSARQAVLGPDPIPTLAWLAVAPPYVAGYAISAAAFLTSARWLLAVARIHREATAIDPFDRAPIYAFSRLTVFMGTAFVFIAYYSFTANYSNQVGNIASLAFLAASVVFGVIAFVAPLWGINGRLVRIKDGLAVDVERRINVVAAELYGRIDAGSVESASTLNATLGGLVTLRDRVGRLPTWPWPPQVLRGFLTALLLPIVVFVLGHQITAVLGG